MLTPQQIQEIRTKAGIKVAEPTAAPVQTASSRIAQLKKDSSTYFQRISQTQSDAADMSAEAYESGAERIGEAAGKTEGALSALQTAGRTAGTIGGTVAGVAMAGGKAALAPISQIKTPEGDTIGERFGNPIKDKFGKAAEYVKENTDWMGDDVQEGIVDVANTAGLSLGRTLSAPLKSPRGLSSTIVEDVAGVAKEGSSIADNLVDSITNLKMPTKSEAAVQRSIVKNFQKGIKPRINANQTPGQARAYKEDIVSAVKSIKENQANLKYADDIADGVDEVIKGKLPENLQQLSNALEQTKGSIFERYDALATKAGQSRLAVKPQAIVKELGAIINDTATKLSHPEVVAYARAVARRYSKVKNLNAKVVQDIIQNYNKSLEAFYKNPSLDTAQRASVDSMVANNLRKLLDEQITKLTGEEYQALKNEYGSLKSIERDVVKAALRDERANVKGLYDMTDVFSGGEVVRGLLTLNPQVVGVGLSMRAIKEIYKHMNNPNRAVKAMFRQSGPSSPKSQSMNIQPKTATKPSAKDAKKNISSNIDVKRTKVNSGDMSKLFNDVDDPILKKYSGSMKAIKDVEQKARSAEAEKWSKGSKAYEKARARWDSATKKNVRERHEEWIEFNKKAQAAVDKAGDNAVKKASKKGQRGFIKNPFADGEGRVPATPEAVEGLGPLIETAQKSTSFEDFIKELGAPAEDHASLKRFWDSTKGMEKPMEEVDRLRLQDLRFKKDHMELNMKETREYVALKAKEKISRGEEPFKPSEGERGFIKNPFADDPKEGLRAMDDEVTRRQSLIAEREKELGALKSTEAAYKKATS